MNIAVIIIIVIVAIVLIAIIAQKAAERERLRLAALADWAHANGFQFFSDDPFNLDSRFNGLADIGRGHNRYAFEVLSRKEPVPTWIFGYRYDTTETRTVTRNGDTSTETYEETHWRSYLIVEMAAAFPKLFIRPETIFDKVAGFVGFEDINFESEEFSRRYFVKSDNREFAYAVIHPQMIEWMMNLKFEGQLSNGVFIADINRIATTAEGRQSALEMASGFIDRIPAFVWQDYGKRTPVQLPLPRLCPPVPSGINPAAITPPSSQ